MGPLQRKQNRHHYTSLTSLLLADATEQKWIGRMGLMRTDGGVCLCPYGSPQRGLSQARGTDAGADKPVNWIWWRAEVHGAVSAFAYLKVDSTINTFFSAIYIIYLSIFLFLWVFEMKYSKGDHHSSCNSLYTRFGTCCFVFRFMISAWEFFLNKTKPLMGFSQMPTELRPTAVAFCVRIRWPTTDCLMFTLCLF